MLVLLAGVVLITLLGGQRGGGAGAERPTVPFAVDDEAMNEAMLDARDSFDEFLSALTEPKPGFHDFGIKVPISDSSGGEHIWLVNIVEAEGKIIGLVANTPNHVRSVRYGQPMVVNPETISDWVYFDRNRRIGGYTLEVMENAIANE